MDIQTLQREIDRLRNDAGSRRQQMNGFTQNAAQYSGNGDYTRAQVEQDQANRLSNEAQELEQKAIEFEREMQQKQDRVQQLQKEREPLQQRITAIDQEIAQLQGNGGMTSII